MPDHAKPRHGQAAVLAGLMLIVPLGILAWLKLGDRPTGPHEEAISAPPAVSRMAPPTPPPSPHATPASSSIHAANAPPEPTEVTLLINPADPDAPKPEGGPLHPHPITPQHERIFRENELIGELFGAMDVKDGAGVRRLADQYRREYPDDPNQLQKGYDIIADCLEHLDSDARSAGQRYYDTERGSILRRFVARHCLGFEL